MSQSSSQVLDEIMVHLMDVPPGRIPTMEHLTQLFPDLGTDQELFDEAETLLETHRFLCGESSDSFTAEDYNIREVGKYTILSRIGRGGFADVYEATSEPGGKIVALKILRPERNSPSAAERFRAEPELLKKVAHRCVVSVLDSGEHRGRPFFTMERIEGTTLSSHALENALLPEQIVSVLQGIAQAVAFAHQKRILHRDLTPQNVLLTPELEPRLCDFGLARELNEGGNETRSSDVIGTINYLAPEVADDATSATERTDVYGLGAILYFLLTGQPPFRGGSPTETMAKLRSEELRFPAQVNPGVDRQLEAVCLKCMRRSPAKRYQSVSEVIDELNRICEGKSVRAPVNHRLRQMVRWIGRNRFQSLMIVLTTVLVVGLVLGFISNVKKDGQLLMAKQQATLQKQHSDDLLRNSELERKAQSARTHMIAGQWSDAIRLYEEVLAANSPGKPSHILQYAKCLLVRRRFSDAKASLVPLLDNKSDPLVYNSAQLWFAEASYREGPNKAILLYQSINEDELELADQYYLKGMLAADLELSANAFSQSLRFDPVHVSATQRLASVHMIRGQFDEALQDLAVCRRLFPDDPNHRFNEAITWSLKGDSQKAEEVFRTCEDAFGEKTAARFRAVAEILKKIRTARPGALYKMSFPEKMLFILDVAGKLLEVLPYEEEVDSDQEFGFELPPGVSTALLRFARKVASLTSIKQIFISRQHAVQFVRDVLTTYPDGALHYALAMELNSRQEYTEAEAELRLALSVPSLIDVRSRSLYVLCRTVHSMHHEPPASEPGPWQDRLIGYLQQFADNDNPDQFEPWELFEITSLAWKYDQYDAAEKVLAIWKSQYPDSAFMLAAHGLHEMYQDRFLAALVYFLDAKRRGSTDSHLDGYIERCCNELNLEPEVFQTTKQDDLKVD